MYESRVTQLGYLGLDVSDMEAWESYANGVLGLQSRGRDADGTLLLKMDSNHHRLALHPGIRDDIAYAGWETTNESSLQAIAERLEANGYPVRRCAEQDVRSRRVKGPDHGGRPERGRQRGLLGPADRGRGLLPFTAR